MMETRAARPARRLVLDPFRQRPSGVGRALVPAMPLDLWTRLHAWRRVRCPFCFERFPASALHFQCDSAECRTDFSRMVDDPILARALHGPRAGSSALRGPWWGDPRTDARRGIRRFFDRFLLPQSVPCPNCGKPATRRLCPCCHRALPDAAVGLPDGHVAVFGPQSVGKTTYVTVLLHELDHRIGAQRGFALDPLTDDVRDRYDREYHEATYGGSRFGIGEEADDATYRRSHSATPSLETHRGVLQPLVFRITRRVAKGTRSALLAFFDTAGEDWEMNVELLRSEARYLGEARGLLFLIDPLRIPAVAHDPRISLTEKERRVPAADYLNDARKLATFFRRVPVNVPLAVCLNKLDRWGKLLPRGTALHDWACGVPDPDQPSLDRTIHDEVASTLSKWGATGFLEYLDVNFPDHRFFACSALGDAATPQDDQAQPLPTPLLVERPVLWLLERQGVL
jgi:GTPase SAR1 family protein